MRAKNNGLNPAVVALSIAVLALALPALCQLNPNPPSSPQKLIFIHHSTGGNWLAAPDGNELGGDLGRALRDGNYFVSATNYDWGPDGIGSNTDIGHWWLWFRGPDSSRYLSALYSENGQNFGDFGPWPRLSSDPGGPNTIVMFKSCFPNSNMGGSPSDPVPAIDNNPLRGQDAYSGDFTVANAKGIYIDILNYFQAHPEKLFVVIVQPPLMQSDTNQTHANNARAFADWLVNDWLDSYPQRNVFVFDFFSVLTSNGGSNRKNDPNTNDLGWADGNHHRYRNGAIEHMKTVNNNFSAYWSGDSHPSRAGNEKATGEFVQLLNIAYNCWKGTGGCPGGPPVCTLTCTATAPASGTAGSALSFQSTATATNCSGGVTYGWNFGDGQTSSQQNPSHTYTTAGTYSWSFTATVSGAAPCTQNGSITITETPVCTLTCTANVPASGTAGAAVAFQSTATATNCSGGVTYGWNFGDGQTSSQQNPSHTYAAAGTFSWTLTANVSGAAPCTQNGSITITETPVCTLTCTAAAPASGTVGVPVAFHSTATATNCTGTISYNWIFGDGSTSAEQSPSHAYTSQGTFSWSFSATADGVTCNQSGTVTVTGGGSYKTYHVRTDGGDAAQCTGLVNAAYPGSGDGQPCAWNHPFQALLPGGQPRIAGGDTLVIHAGSYKMGIGAAGSGNCSQDSPWDCYMLSIPSGPDAAHPTRVVGEMAEAGCTAKPELWGTERPYHIVDLHGSSHVELACLDITDHSSCIEDHNQSNRPCDGCTQRCNRDQYPYGDWAMSGISGRDSDDVRITDVDVHGLANMGIHAGRVSNWTLERVKIIGNGWSGWNGDLWEDSSNSGTILFRDVEIAYNGCSEAYPAETITMNTCWGQETGGYGDGLGTFTTGGKWVFEDCKIHHNTSDGLDLLYLDTTGSVEVKRLWAEGNAGNQLKTSGPASVENSVLIGNCAFFAGQPLMLEGDNCRAAGNTVSIDVHRGSRVTLMNNTVTGQGDCLLIVGCNDSSPEDPDPNCDGTERVLVNNTLFYGNLEWNQSDEWTCLTWYDDGQIPADPLSMDYNLVFRAKDDPCPGSHDVCKQDPLLTNPDISKFDGHLLAASPAINMGTLTGSPVDDFDRKSRDAQPDIGAYEYSGAAQCSLTCAATVQSTGSVATPIQFASTANGTNCTDPLTYSWDFGDGSSGQGQNVEHTYLSAGVFSWSLTVSSGSAKCTKGGAIAVTSCCCTLTCDATVPSVGNTSTPVQFSATATPDQCSAAVTYEWDFGDGTPAAGGQNVSHSYTVSGDYEWKMTARAGDVTCVKTGRIQICGITCTATATPGSGNIPLLVRFAATAGLTNCASIEATFSWEFGDGGSSSSQAPEHTYSEAGTYSWTMTASLGGMTCIKTGAVTARKPGQAVPGDCDGDGMVSIGEVQKAINMFLGTAQPGCGADCNGDGKITIGEVQKVINAFLGLPSSC